VSLVSLLSPAGPSGYGYGSTAEEVTRGHDLSGKTVVITGAASGLGGESLRVMGLRGAFVISLARTEARAADALRRGGADGYAVACDLSEPGSVRAAAGRITALGRPLDVVLCNAGVMAVPTLEVKHGLELQFLTNHVGHFMLVSALVATLAERGRVVVVSSAAHRRVPTGGIDFDNLDGSRGYHPWRAYGRSKLANLLFARTLAARLPGEHQTANALHPGVIATNLLRHLGPVVNGLWRAGGPLVLKSVAAGAATQCYLSTHPAVAEVSGEYFASCNTARSSSYGRDLALGDRLWEETEAIVRALA